MQNSKTDLSSYNNKWYSPGAGFLKRALWYLISTVFFTSRFPLSSIRVSWLRLFGAKIGKGVVIKPSVNIKYPWKLEIGSYAWIGEHAWIDNLANVSIGSNACISQGALLLTGNHDYKKNTFDLIVQEIRIEDGAWVGAKALVGPGVTCRSHSVLSAGSVAVSDLEAYGIYQGNPAVKVRERMIS